MTPAYTFMVVEPERGSLNESHIHLVEWMCEELYDLAEDHDDPEQIEGHC